MTIHVPPDEERYFPDLGFTEDAEVVATDEYLAGLVGGDVWVAQGESDAIWGAPGRGHRAVEDHRCREERRGLVPRNPRGHRCERSGRQEDDRVQALLAGQIDVAVLQARHLLPLDEGGGEMIYQEYHQVPQEVWVVKAETMEQNRDVVCAYLQDRITAKQWLSEGEDYQDNKDEGMELGRSRDSTRPKGISAGADSPGRPAPAVDREVLRPYLGCVELDDVGVEVVVGKEADQYETCRVRGCRVRHSGWNGDNVSRCQRGACPVLPCDSAPLGHVDDLGAAGMLVRRPRTRRDPHNASSAAVREARGERIG